MNASELKLMIFRQIDSLEESKLEDFYGVLLNYVNGQNDLKDWLKLTEEQKQGIMEGLFEIDSGKGLPHEEIVAKYRKMYPNS